MYQNASMYVQGSVFVSRISVVQDKLFKNSMYSTDEKYYDRNDDTTISKKPSKAATGNNYVNSGNDRNVKLTSTTKCTHSRV